MYAFMMGAWVNRFCLIVLLGLALSGCANSSVSNNYTNAVSSPEVRISETPTEPQLALIVGTPSKVKYFGDNVGPEGENGEELITLAAWYEFKFKKFDVIFGDISEGKLTLYLLGHALREHFSSDIFVLIDVSDKDDPRGLWWGSLREFVCLGQEDYEYLVSIYGKGRAKENLEEFSDMGRAMCLSTGS